MGDTALIFTLGEQPARDRLRAGDTAAIDLFQTADDILTLFKAGAVADAATALDLARRGRHQAVQDALDRLVAARRQVCHAPPAGSGPEIAATLGRVTTAYFATPRMPDTTQMAALTEQQRHDVYASIVEIEGTAAATVAATAGHRVVLGLRASQSTLANRGQGVYNDRFVVLRAQRQARTAAEFLVANTEPTAQYDANQRRAQGIVFRRADGDDITRDGVPELGRMGEGTYAMLATTHANPTSAGTNFSLRPTADAVAGGAGLIQRDSNHDGLFTSADPNGRQSLNNSFKIHSGSRTNTDSAGCQTIHPGDYARFATAVQGNGQAVWQYVLVETAP